jgi:hypothetical protein
VRNGFPVVVEEGVDLVAAAASGSSRPVEAT